MTVSRIQTARRPLVALALLSSVLTLASHSSAQSFFWEQEKGKTIRVLLNQHPWTNAIVPFIPEFEKQTGIKVVLETFPESQFRQKVLVELASGAGSLDAFMLTPNQEGTLYSRSGWLEPLDPFLKNPSLTPSSYQSSDFFPSTLKAARIDNALIGLPVSIETTVLFYRKDLLEKYKVAIPRSFAQLEAAAKTLNGKDGAVGIALRGKGASSTSQFAPYLFGYGGTWLRDGKSNFTAPETQKALTYYTNLLRNYGPASASTMSWQEITSLFAQGKVAMFTDASIFRAVVEDPKSSTVVGKIGYAPFPSGPGGRKPNVLTWTLAMSKTSANKNATWLFMQWASNPQNQLRALLADVPAARRSAWNAPSFRAQDKNPEWTKVNLAQLAYANPVWNPPVSSVGEVRDVLGQAIVGALQGGNVSQLLERAARDTDAIIAKEK